MSLLNGGRIRRPRRNRVGEKEGSRCDNNSMRPPLARMVGGVKNDDKIWVGKEKFVEGEEWKSMLVGRERVIVCRRGLRGWILSSE